MTFLVNFILLIINVLLFYQKNLEFLKSKKFNYIMTLQKDNQSSEISSTISRYLEKKLARETNP